jgi:hypothetical protein
MVAIKILAIWCSRRRRQLVHPNPTGIRFAPRDSGACSPAAPSSFSPTSASIRSPPPPRRRAIRSGYALRHHRLAHRLHRPLRGRGAGAARHDEVFGLRLRAWPPRRRWPTPCSSSARGPSGVRHHHRRADRHALSSLLVFQYGQARIWFAMSRDRLLPKFFSRVHPRFKTPHWSTWIAGLRRRPAGRPGRYRRRRRPLQHRHAFRLRPGLARRHPAPPRQPERPRGFRVPLGAVVPHHLH